MANEFFSGLVKTDESFEFMRSTARAYAAPSAPIEPLEEFDPSSFIKIENQRQRNSCVGNSLSSCGEGCGLIDSGFKFTNQFSRWGMYIWAQELGGMGGKDNGAQMQGGIRAATMRGFPSETLWPYPRDNERYSMREPAGAREDAAKFKLLKQVRLKSWEEADEFQKQGRGLLWFGTNWTLGMANGREPITRADVRTRSIGEHAYYGWGWRRNGNWIIHNSHDVTYGINGHREMTRQAAEELIANDECYGLSDLENVQESRKLVGDWGRVA